MMGYEEREGTNVTEIACASVCVYKDEKGICTQKKVCFGKHGECWTRGYQEWRPLSKQRFGDFK